MSSYQVRRIHIGTSEQLDELARECGRLYSQTLASFWRTVRHKGIWLKPKHLMRWHTSNKLHAHTADACVQAFFAGLNSWRQRRKENSNAKPPHKRKRYFRIEYKHSAMSLKDGYLRPPTARAMRRSCSYGPGTCRRRWSFIGQGPSMRPLLPICKSSPPRRHMERWRQAST